MGATPRKFKNGEILFQEGAPTGSVFLIQRGEVSIRKRRGSGTVEIARLRPSQLLGELSFFDRRPRSATAVALGTVEVVEIDFAALDGIYESVPSYFKAMMTALATRLRAANDTIRRLEQEAAKAAAEAEARTSKAIH